MSTITTIPLHSEVRTPRRASWRSTPQRIWLRRAIFQIHLWLGLLLTLYAVVIGLSGSALVFRPEIERHLHPQLVHILPAPQRTTLAATMQRVEHDRPGWVVSSLKDFNEPTQATTLLLHRTGSALDANYRAVSVNPYTGQVLADKMRFAGILGWLANLHYYLLAGRKGLLVSGWMALGLLLLCLTGLVVWWPGVARWRSSLIVRPHARWRRLNWDLHSAIGFWFSASLLLLCVTGLYFAFPAPVARVVLFTTHSSQAAEPRPAKPHTSSQAGAPMTADQAILTARRLLPLTAPPDYLALPSRPGAPIYATGYYLGTAPYSQLVSVSFDAHTGVLLSSSDTRQGSLGARLIQLAFAIHFGSFAGEGPLGLCVKFLWVLAGLSPAVLALTGLLMYWNRKLSPMLRRRRSH